MLRMNRRNVRIMIVVAGLVVLSEVGCRRLNMGYVG